MFVMNGFCEVEFMVHKGRSYILKIDYIDSYEPKLEGRALRTHSKNYEDHDWQNWKLNHQYWNDYIEKSLKEIT